MQFIDLAAQQKRVYPSLLKRIEKVLSHGKYIMGPEVDELEKKLADFVGIKHVIACSSGTDALMMALMAYEVKPGDLIFTTPFTFVATAEVITLLGATPVFVDIDPKTFNIDPRKLEFTIEAIKNTDSSTWPIPDVNRFNIEKGFSPRGIIAVDLFGLPADYDKIKVIARDNGLFLIGDAAQSFGAVYKNKMVGTLCDITTTSFFPAKPLGCYGDGGAIFTDDDNLANILKSIRVHGKGDDKYDNVRIGVNGRLDTLQAAILLEKLNIFPDEIEARNRVAEKYTNAMNEYVRTPHIPADCRSVWAQYSILSGNRDDLQVYLKKTNIPTAVYYPKPLHLQKAFSKLGYKRGDFPVAEETSLKILSLPMHPYLQDKQVNEITQQIISFEKQKKS